MKTRTITQITLAVAAAARILAAQNATAFQPAPAITAPPSLEFSPMTTSEHARRYVTHTFGPRTVGSAALHAEFGQLTNNPKEWGHGVGGFSNRLGSAFGLHVVRNTLEYGASSVLHEDNRYLPQRRKGAWSRLKYAVTSSFLARHPNGRRSFSFSGVGSAAGAAFISRAWLPSSAATAGAAAGSFGITIGASVGINVLREFWPDLKKHLRRI